LFTPRNYLDIPELQYYVTPPDRNVSGDVDLRSEGCLFFLDLEAAWITILRNSETCLVELGQERAEFQSLRLKYK